MRPGLWPVLVATIIINILSPCALFYAVVKGRREQRVWQMKHNAGYPVPSHGFGRARRYEYLPIALVLPLAYGFLEKLAEGGCNPLLLAIFWMALLAVDIIESIRRLHDLGVSGGWLILMFISPLCWFMALMMRGTKGPNKYGPDPRDV